MKRLLRFAPPAYLISLVALASCGGGDSTAPPTPPAPAVASVTVTPSTNPLLVGGTVTLTASVKDGSGNTMTGQTLTWSSDAQSIATVSQNGVATAVAPGAANITASTSGKSGTAAITVIAPIAPVATVTVTPLTPSVVVNGTVTLSAEVKDAVGATLAGRTVVWSTSAQAIATITQAGVVTAVAPGTAIISATSEGKTGTATITVTNPFNPSTSTTLAGTQRYTSISIPAGVTITASGDLNLSASGAITIAGTLTGNCVTMIVAADGAALITGAISNACTDANADGKDLTVLGKAGVNVAASTINSSGEILITNDLTLTDANFPVPTGALVTARSGIRTGATARQAIAAAVTHACAFSGNRPAAPPARAGTAGTTGFAPGSSGKGLRMSCRGNGEVGHPAAGATVTSQAGGVGGAGTSTSTTFAEARAGAGGNGGTLRVLVTGDLAIVGVTNFVSGDGGAGGVATATGRSNPGLNKQPNAQATGGKGGEPGLVDIRAGGAVNIAAALNIVIGRAGEGGSATATGAPGLNATDISPAKEGGDANATGGEGGSTPNRSLAAFGSIAAAGFVSVRGGDAGSAGRATGTAGVGGIGNEIFPTGGKGGSFSFNTNAAPDGSNARVGYGGNAQLKNLQGIQFGRGGDGSITSAIGGNGGAGWSDCNIPRKAGGIGGAGGSVAGRDGAFGLGAIIGFSGGFTMTNVGNGGKGGNGQGPGAGGNPGVDASVPIGAKNMVAPDFQKGAEGNPCAPLAVRIGVINDFNVHEPHVRYTGVNALSVTTNGNAITLSGAAPWVTVTGTLDGSNFVATGAGTVAGYPNVPVRFTGSITSTGAITGTIQIGQSSPPTGLPNGPVTYGVTPPP